MHANLEELKSAGLKVIGYTRIGAHHCPGHPVLGDGEGNLFVNGRNGLKKYRHNVHGEIYTLEAFGTIRRDRGSKTER